MDCTKPPSAASVERPCPLADPDALGVPEAHGHCIVSPPSDRLRAAVEYNQRLFASYDFQITGQPVQAVRDWVRSQVIGQSVAPATPIIATGHQPDFFHAGVWAKHVVADRLANALGGIAVDLIVDHDVAKQAGIDVPTVREEMVQIDEVAYADFLPDHPFENLARASVDRTNSTIEQFKNAMGDRFDDSLLATFFEAYQSKTDGDWVDQALTGRSAVERELGVTLLQRRTGQVWYSPFLGEMLCKASEFARDYNRALAGEQLTDGTHGPDGAISMLHTVGGAIELPLWINHPGRPRHHLSVKQSSEGVTLLAGQQPVATIAHERLTSWEALSEELARLHPWVIRPRALVLTMWARLFWADLFIHGIGGNRYDQITDRLIRNVFNVEPPVMACVSATLRMNLPTTGATIAKVESAHRSLRDIEFNPHRYITHSDLPDLQAQKEQLIAESQRLRAEERFNAKARADVFKRIRSLNTKINALQPDRRTELRKLRDTLEMAIDADRNAQRRDYFFAMHARRDLQLLLENLPSVQQLKGSDIV